MNIDEMRKRLGALAAQKQRTEQLLYGIVGAMQNLQQMIGEAEKAAKAAVEKAEDEVEKPKPARRTRKKGAK